ncbi:unnamed protein product [Brachionus calyciflorus]|uniref:FLYWCH-type domain-containing protein n=1 Tax=Brachionus calyciflorus TaxID=104777 RepID=A0A814LZC7_9BILA|nr:unnamed protein product [Brachionus calyciflorus]
MCELSPNFKSPKLLKNSKNLPNIYYLWKDKTLRYNCSLRRKDKCTASLKLHNDEVIIDDGDHFCEEHTDSSIQCIIAQQYLKKKVTIETSKSVKSLYNEAQTRLIHAQIPEESIATNLKSFNRMGRTLYNRKASKQPSVPTEFSDLHISGQYATTFKNDKFLQYDNKSTDKRIIIFSELLRILSESKFWFIDGTYKTAPRNLLQLYVTQRLVKNTNETLPFFYILTMDRSESTYKEAFGIKRYLSRIVANDEELFEHAFDDFLRQFNVNENFNNEIAQQKLHNTG